jgi:hypothetical protein
MKEETIEEAVERLFKDFLFENPIIPKEDIRPFKLGFIKGTKWQSKRMYSEEDMKKAIRFGFDKGFCSNSSNKIKNLSLSEQEWFTQIKENKLNKK